MGGGRCWVTGVGEAAVGPGQQVGFLVEDGFGGEGPVEGRLRHRAAVPAQHGTGWHGGHVDTACHRHLAGVADPGHQRPERVEGGGGGDGGGDLADQLGGPPRRLPLHQPAHGLVHDPGRGVPVNDVAGDRPPNRRVDHLDRVQP